jgi:hypothetical protein
VTNPIYSGEEKDMRCTDDNNVPCKVTIIPQSVSNVGISVLGPILRRSRFAGSSAAIYGLGRFSTTKKREKFPNVHIKNGETDLILLIRHVEVLLQTGNASIPCGELDMTFEPKIPLGK